MSKKKSKRKPDRKRLGFVFPHQNEIACPYCKTKGVTVIAFVKNGIQRRRCARGTVPGCRHRGKPPQEYIRVPASNYSQVMAESAAAK